jgi:hypothetical protein
MEYEFNNGDKINIKNTKTSEIILDKNPFIFLRHSKV